MWNQVARLSQSTSVGSWESPLIQGYSHILQCYLLGKLYLGFKACRIQPHSFMYILCWLEHGVVTGPPTKVKPSVSSNKPMRDTADLDHDEIWPWDTYIGSGDIWHWATPNLRKISVACPAERSTQTSTMMLFYVELGDVSLHSGMGYVYWWVCAECWGAVRMQMVKVVLVSPHGKGGTQRSDKCNGMMKNSK